MTGNTSKEDQLREYLLNRLSEAEQKRLERRLLLEDRLFQMGQTVAQGPEEQAALEDELRSLEGVSDEELEEREQAFRAELFDAYARGELGAEDRQWVDWLAQGSNQDRERLAFARALAQAEEAVLPKKKVGGFQVRPRRWIWQGAAGLAATIAIVLALHVGRIGVHQPALPPIVITIPWGGVRGGDIFPLSIPRAASKLDIHIPLSAAATFYSTFEVVILARNEQTLGGPRKVVKSSDQTLRFEEDAEAWKDGTYTLQISGLPENGQPPAELGDIQVVVTRH